MSGLHWPGLLRLGLSELRLTPDQFWALTPAELLVMAGLDADPGGAGMTRSTLAALVADFPDGPMTRGGGDDRHQD